MMLNAKKVLVVITLWFACQPLRGQDYVLLQDGSILAAEVITVYSPTSVRIKESRGEYDISMPMYQKIIFGNRKPKIKAKATVSLKDGRVVAGFMLYGDSASMMLWMDPVPYVPGHPEKVTEKILFGRIQEIKLDAKGATGQNAAIGFTAGFVTGAIVGGLASTPDQSPPISQSWFPGLRPSPLGPASTALGAAVTLGVVGALIGALLSQPVHKHLLMENQKDLRQFQKLFKEHSLLASPPLEWH